MAKGQNIVTGGAGRKPPAVAPRTAPATPRASPAAPLAAVKKRVSPVQFLREVRAEARKVTWTSWKETWITSVMVGIMVVVAALFFFGIDALFSFGMDQVLKLGKIGS
jgi:preprotein translocase subunit SecE